MWVWDAPLALIFRRYCARWTARPTGCTPKCCPICSIPWRADWAPAWQTESYKALVADPLHTIFGQVIFGGQMARLLKQFNLRPDAAIGYSLGESAGLFALDAWPDHGQMLERLASSDLFKTQLCGPCEALRRTWQIPADQDVQWRVAVVNRPAAQVDAAIAEIPHVRRLIINTPNECVIGGLDAPVAQAIKQLGCEALYLDGVVTVHCDAAQPVAEAYKDLHRFPTSTVGRAAFLQLRPGRQLRIELRSGGRFDLATGLERIRFSGNHPQGLRRRRPGLCRNRPPILMHAHDPADPGRSAAPGRDRQHARRRRVPQPAQVPGDVGRRRSGRSIWRRSMAILQIISEPET